MSLGSTVRRLIGPLEPKVAETYRRLFIDLDDLGRTLSRLGPVSAILEVGAGDGSLAARLCRAFPAARYVGVDIMAEPGRLFVGDRTRADFRSIRLEEVASSDLFDMVVFADVLHHVPPAQRGALLAAAVPHLRADGFLVIKDWERGRNPIHMLAYISDRFISADRHVAFFDPGELASLLADSIPGLVIRLEARVPPRHNNLLLVLQLTTAIQPVADGVPSRELNSQRSTPGSVASQADRPSRIPFK